MKRDRQLLRFPIPMLTTHINVARHVSNSVLLRSMLHAVQLICCLWSGSAVQKDCRHQRSTEVHLRIHTYLSLGLRINPLTFLGTEAGQTSYCVCSFRSGYLEWSNAEMWLKE